MRYLYLVAVALLLVACGNNKCNKKQSEVILPEG